MREAFESLYVKPGLFIFILLIQQERISLEMIAQINTI